MVTCHVLSERASCSHSSWANNFELEDILVETCNASILAPEQYFAHTRVELVTGRLRNGRYRKVKNTSGSRGADLLVLIGMGPSALRMLNSIPDWRKSYGQVVAYIVDIYPPAELSFDRKLAENIDALFVSYSQMVTPLLDSLEIPIFFIPQATNVLGTGGFNPDKRIDVAAFGRQPNQVIDRLTTESISNSRSNFFAWWSAQTYPYSRNMARDRAAFLSVLRRSQISLCYRFEDTHAQSYRGVSPITARWFESAAAGCAIAGSRPSSPEGSETLNWPDSVIELSTDGASCIAQLRELLRDPQSLREIGFRNFRAASLGHDWGHRVASILDILSMEHPQRLKDRLGVLTKWGAADIQS